MGNGSSFRNFFNSHGSCQICCKNSKSKKYDCKESCHSPKEVSLEDFDLLRPLGNGSFGNVCLVRQTSTEKLFAMKCVNKRNCMMKDMTTSIRREIEILEILDHPFVIKLWHNFQDEEDIYLVFDLLSGGDLRRRLEEKGCLPESKVLLYLCEAALALDYLQTKRILHRDIKPDNLLLDSRGHVRITDFNVAICLATQELATSMSGTKPYIAPEIYQCVLNLSLGYSYPADWWSLGISAYEMLCGRRPYDIHSKTNLEDVLNLFNNSKLAFPKYINFMTVDLVGQFLSLEVENRIRSLEGMKNHELLKCVNFDLIYNLQKTTVCITETKINTARQIFNTGNMPEKPGSEWCTVHDIHERELSIQSSMNHSE